MGLLENLGINWKILLAQVVNFLLVLYLLKRFVFSSFLEVLKKRKEKIEEGIRKSEAAEGIIQAIKKTRVEILGKAREDAYRLIKEGGQKGEEMSKQIILQTKEEREKMLKEAIEEAERKKEELRKGARQEILKTGLILAEEILKEKVNLEKDKEIIKRLLAKYEKSS